VIFSTFVMSSDSRSISVRIIKVCAVRRHSGDVILLSYTYVVFARLIVFGWTNRFAGLTNIYGSRAARQGKMHITTSVYYTVYYCIYDIIFTAVENI